MSSVDNAIAARPVTASEPRAGAAREPAGGGASARRARLGVLPPGLLLGSLGIIGFSFSLPATRLAVADLDPWVVAFAAVKRAHEHPSRAFWLAAGAGLVAVLAFVLTQGVAGLQAGDAFLLGAVVLCAIGYAEGGALSRTLGGPTTICWALVLAAPLTASVTGLAIALTGLHAGTTAWLGFAYVAVVSMFLGFFAWYAGLARGGVARIGQVQLAQPVLTLGWSAALLGEQVGLATLLTALAVLACVAATQRAR